MYPSTIGRGIVLGLLSIQRNLGVVWIRELDMQGEERGAWWAWRRRALMLGSMEWSGVLVLQG